VRKALSKYVIEIAIVLLGAIIATLEAVFADRNVGLVVGFLSLLLALAVVAIRQEIATQVGDTIEDRKLLRSIPEARWRLDAQLELEEAYVRYISWAGGTRRVERDKSLAYEVNALSHAAISVRAIHLAADLESLRMWTEPQKKFHAMVEAYRRLPGNVQCRRILVLSEADDGISVEEEGQRVIQDPVALTFCELQRDERPAGLGFSLRVLWNSEHERAIGDLLIIDGRETCSIESYGHGRFSDLEACVTSALVHRQVLLFEDLWKSAIPIESCIQSSATR
jgi:hypothetical protein